MRQIGGIAVSIGLLLACCAGAPEPPDTDASGMEPRVARALEAARAEVLGAPRSAEAWGGLGAVLQAHDLVGQARFCYDQAQQLDAHDFRWAYLGAVAAEQDEERFDEVRRLFESAARLRGDYAPLWVRAGEAGSRRGRLDEAERALRHAIELDPDLAVAWRNLGRLLLGRNLEEEAVAHLLRAVELAPDDGAAWSGLAQAQLRAGRPDLARAAAARADATRPFGAIHDPIYADVVLARAVSSKGALLRARGHLRAGQYQEALEGLAIALEANPNDADLHYWLGVAHGETGRMDEALRDFDRAIALRPDLVPALVRSAGLLELREDHEAAVERYRQAASLAPDNRTIGSRLGLSLIRAGRSVEAIEVFRDVTRRWPDDAGAWLALGQACELAGDPAQARAAYAESARLDPNGRAAARVAR